MKKFVVFLFAVSVSPAISYCQWNASSSVNTPVCIQTYDQQDVRIVSDSKGGAIVTWLDFRNDAAMLVGDIFVQRLDKNGNAKWTAQGVSLCSDAANQAAPSLVEDGSGGAIIAWNDWRNGNRDVYAQKIDSSGNVKWAANGVAVVAKAAHQQDAKLISDGAGGAIIVWQDSANGPYDIYAQRMNSAGAVMWTAGGVVICNNAASQVNPKIEIDGAGGAIITWQDKRNGTDYDIYAQHVNASGTAQWAANGISICSILNTTQSNPKIEPDGAGGAIIAWQDKRNGDYDVYAQRVSGAGAVQWTANGIAICSLLGTSQSAVDMTSEGISGAIIAWKDQRSGNFDVYAQMINLSGVVQWTANGVGIATSTAQQYNPNTVGDGSGGAIIVWQDSTGASWDVKSQRINGSGVIQWAAGGVMVGNAANSQTSPKSVSDGGGGCIYAWQDKRNTTDLDIYAHHLYSNGTTNSSVNDINIFVESRVFPNPFVTSAVIVVNSQNPDDMKFSVCDVLGQKVEILFSISDNRISILRGGLENGIYFYEVRIGSNGISKGKIILSE